MAGGARCGGGRAAHGGGAGHRRDLIYNLDLKPALLQAVRGVAAGGQHTVAVLDSAVYAWGSNRCGQLGTRTFRDRDTPAEVWAALLI